MLARSRLLPALGAFFVLAAAVAGCGDSVPGNAVARIGDESITRDKFNHWFGITQAQMQGPAAGAQKTVYDPPDYTACVAKLRKAAPKPAAGQPKQTDATFRTQCKSEYEQLRDQTMLTLISEVWVRNEAEDQGLEATPAEINKKLAETKSQFPKPADYQKALKDAGLTEQDLRFQLTYDVLATKLRDKVLEDADKISNADIREHYDKNKDKFAEPEKRDIRVVLTKTKARADQAKAALERGDGWKAVARRYSIDESSKAKGGALEGLPKGNQEKTLDDAIFGAAKGKLTGPVKTQFGYYVFQVQKITPAKQQTLKEASAAIKRQLETERRDKLIKDFSEDLRDKWKERTNCREGFVTQECKNAPKPKTTATQPAGGAQPQDPQQPAQP